MNESTLRGVWGLGHKRTDRGEEETEKEKVEKQEDVVSQKARQQRVLRRKC